LLKQIYIVFNDILVVCIGNICRSPMAEAVLAHALRDRQKVNVSSAGLGALVGHPADPIAQELLQARGLDISGHRARMITNSILHSAELVLVMELIQKREIESKYPSSRGKVFRLGEWRQIDIQDPFQQQQQAFEHALALIDQSIADWLPRL
jgi:protein-tyrosine phosphatase